MSGAKTEDPTPQRLRELRRKGEVPTSRELTRSAALLGGLAGLCAIAPGAVRELAALSTDALGGRFADPVVGLSTAVAWLIATALPIAAAAAVMAMGAGMVQTGAVFAPGRILPDSRRLAPGETWRSRLKADAMTGAMIALVATLGGAVIAAVGIHVLVRSSGALAEYSFVNGPLSTTGLVLDGLVVVVGGWVAISLALAAIDWSHQRRAFMQRNRMSLQEIRDEVKRSEGDPEHKARRERAHRELLAADLRSGVGRADVIVTNPVHVAVGLRYRADEIDAPVVTVSGRGDRARAIRREARRRGVPEYTDPPSARAVVEVEVGDAIPESLFEPIAIVFRWLAEHR